MALPWPTGSSTLPRPVPAASGGAVADMPSTTAPSAARGLSHLVTLAREAALSPVTALLAMVLGLAMLFVLPLVGLPFVALVVLPVAVYHLQVERRPRFRRGRR